MQTSLLNDFRDKQRVLKLTVGALRPPYHLPVTSYLRLFALVYIIGAF